MSKILNENRYIDWFILYMIGKKFTTRFSKWKAYDLGLIDEKGKRTNKRITTTEEKNAYTLLDRMIRKIRVFVGDKWFLKLTLAYLLLKEDSDIFPSRKRLINENEDISKQFTIKISPLEDVTVSLNDDFSIFSSLKDLESNEYKITSKFEIKNVNREDMENLNVVFNGLGESNSYSFTVQGEEENYTINVNIGVSELKIESILSSFYIVFNNLEQVEEFKNKWNTLVNA